MSFRFEVWDPPGIATFERKIAAVPAVSASGTVYRRQTGRGSITIPGDYSRLGEIIDVDPANHANDVASTIRVYRYDDWCQDLVVKSSPNLVAGQDATLTLDGIETVLDWAVVEAWDWDGEPDFVSTVPNWTYGGRNLIPPLELGDLGSIRETWTLYLSGERYELDTSLATSGTFTLTVSGNTTGAIAYNASAITIQNALEALAGVTTVSVVQPDPDTREFFVSFENPKDLGSDMTLTDSTGGGGVVLNKLNDGFNTGASPTFSITVDGQTTSALAWNSSANQVEGSPLTGNGLEGLSNVDDVTVSGTGVLADPWEIVFYSPPDPTTVTVTFAAGTAVLTKIEEGDPDPTPVTVSQTVDASVEAGLHGCGSPISVVTTPLDTGADWSLLVEAACRFDGSQIVLPVTAGQTYQASIRIRPTVSGYYTLVIRDEFENLIRNPSPRDNYLTAGSFQTISISDIQIPPGVEYIIMRVAVTDPNSAAWADYYVNWQGAEFREGMAATTVGAIMGELMADAQTDHASGTFPRTTLTFINETYTDAVDSAGNAWTESEVSVDIPRGMTYRKVLERIFGQLGYEWSVTPTSGTPGEWDLNIWNPDGRGTDYSSADTPSILFGQGTESGSATRTLPPGNIVISEGAGYYTSRASNSASYGTIGRREWWQTDISYQQTQVDSWTDRQLARFLSETLNPRFEIADPPAGSSRPVPLIGFGLADTMNVDLATGGGKVSRQVEAISWRTVDDGIMFGVQLGDTQFDNIGGLSGGGSGGSVDMAAMGPVNEGVRRLIDAFKRPQFQPAASAFVPSGGGGAPTIVVAASDASDISKRKADYVCNGSSDTATLQTAIAALPTSPRQMGRLLLTEGTFYIYESGAADVFEVGSNVHIQGMGRLTTRISVAANATTTNRVLFDLRDGSLLSDLTIEKNASLTLTSNSYTAVGLFGVRCGLRDVDILEVGALGGSSETSVWSGNSQPYQFIDNCYIEAPKRALYAVTASEFHLTDSYLSSDDGEVVYLSGVERFFMRGNTVVGVATDTNILMVGTCRDWWIVDNDIQAGLNGIYLDNSASGTSGRGFILGNHFSNFIEECGVFLNLPNSGPAYVVIADNLIQSVGQGVSFGNAAGAIRCIGDDIDPLTDKNNDQEPGLIVAHNRLEGLGLGYGIKLEAIEGALVQGNHVEDPGNHAIYVSGGGWNRILDNLALWPRSSDAFDGVYVDADECYVSRNQVVDHSGAGPSYFRYGINVAGGYCNIVVGNDLVATGGGTDYLIDSGTSTILSYPGDMTYGDNFTDCGAS